MGVPRTRLISPVDVSSLLVGAAVTTPTTRDLSAYLPPQAEAVLLRRRASPDRSGAGVLMVRPTGTSLGAGNAQEINRSQDVTPTSVPDALIWCGEKWVRVDALNQLDMWRANTTNAVTETLTLLGYGFGGKCYNLLDSPVDASAVLPGDAVTTPTVADFTSLLPAGVTAGALDLIWDCRVAIAAGTKQLRARENGGADTSAVLTNVGTADDRVSLGRGEQFTVRCDGSNQIELWYDTGAATAVNNLLLRGYWVAEVKA